MSTQVPQKDPRHQNRPTQSYEMIDRLKSVSIHSYGSKTFQCLHPPEVPGCKPYHNAQKFAWAFPSGNGVFWVIKILSM